MLPMKLNDFFSIYVFINTSFIVSDKISQKNPPLFQSLFPCKCVFTHDIHFFKNSLFLPIHARFDEMSQKWIANLRKSRCIEAAWYKFNALKCWSYNLQCEWHRHFVSDWLAGNFFGPRIGVLELESPVQNHLNGWWIQLCQCYTSLWCNWKQYNLYKYTKNYRLQELVG